MKKFFLFAATAIFFSHLAYATPPDFNLGDNKILLKQYHDSGTYDHDLFEMMQPTTRHIDKTVSNNKNAKLAIVFDIDETALSNYKMLAKNDFGATPTTLREEQKQIHASPIEPVLTTYNYAKKLGVHVFFITGRTEEYRINTIQNLKYAGYHGWDKLYMKANGKHYKSAADYKTQIREQLSKQGYKIILNIGDQCSDLSDGPNLVKHADKTIDLPKECGNAKGSYAEMVVKLPNPFYHVN